MRTLNFRTNPGSKDKNCFLCFCKVATYKNSHAVQLKIVLWNQNSFKTVLLVFSNSISWTSETHTNHTKPLCFFVGKSIWKKAFFTSPVIVYLYTRNVNEISCKKGLNEGPVHSISLSEGPCFLLLQLTSYIMHIFIVSYWTVG